MLDKKFFEDLGESIIKDEKVRAIYLESAIKKMDTDAILTMAIVGLIRGQNPKLDQKSIHRIMKGVHVIICDKSSIFEKTSKDSSSEIALTKAVEAFKKEFIDNGIKSINEKEEEMKKEPKEDKEIIQFNKVMDLIIKKNKYSTKDIEDLTGVIQNYKGSVNLVKKVQQQMSCFKTLKAKNNVIKKFINTVIK